MSHHAEMELEGLTAQQRGQISAWCRERQLHEKRSPMIYSSALNEERSTEFQFLISEILSTYVPRTLTDTLDRALVNLAILSSKPGHTCMVSAEDYLVCFADSQEQLNFFINALEKRGWLTAGITACPNPVTLSIDGWLRIAELERARPLSSQAFIAMAFSDDLNDAWHQGIFPGVRDAGYEPLRIDKKEHNEKICDLIIAEIRKSKFLVADFTLHRQGVYFEAGYALGLGIPVIWTCREDRLETCHFDTRQYSHVVWSSAEQLAGRLRDRIEALMGRGPLGSRSS